MPNLYFFLHGTHVHHLNYGIFLLAAVCGRRLLFCVLDLLSPNRSGRYIQNFHLKPGARNTAPSTTACPDKFLLPMSALPVACRSSCAGINASIRGRGASHSDHARHVRQPTRRADRADSTSVPRPTPRKFRSTHIRRQSRRSLVPVRRPPPFPPAEEEEPAGQPRCRLEPPRLRWTYLRRPRPPSVM